LGYRKVADARLLQRAEQILRHADEPEPADEQRRAGLDVGDRRGGRVDDLRCERALPRAERADAPHRAEERHWHLR
jgi:hypothetical protein